MGQYGPTSYNFDINQPGASQYPRFSVSQNSPYKDGLVEDIILNETHPQYSAVYGTNIGMIQVRLIPEDRGVPKEQLNWAMPLETSIREYPLKNEMVMVFYSVGRLFYTRRININNKITENSWPGLSQKFSPQEVNARAENIKLAAEGGPSYRPWGNPQSTTLGDEFAENPSAKMARANEGDMIIQGRFGNIMRLGSSLFSNPTSSRPEPNLLITVGQASNKVNSTQKESPFSLVFEDINKDKSCIWMVTDEKILLEPATIDSVSHLRSSESSDSINYTGAQIFINSDRLILNSKLNEISLFSKKEINLSAVESITVDSSRSVIVTAEQDITLKSSQDTTISAIDLTLSSSGNILQETSGNFIISGKKIFIGSGDAKEPMVLGNELAKLLYELVDALQTATVITSTGPAFFNPTIVTRLQILLGKLGTRSSPELATFNSTSNFTSKTN